MRLYDKLELQTQTSSQTYPIPHFHHAPIPPSPSPTPHHTTPIPQRLTLLFSSSPPSTPPGPGYTPVLHVLAYEQTPNFTTPSWRTPSLLPWPCYYSFPPKPAVHDVLAYVEVRRKIQEGCSTEALTATVAAVMNQIFERYEAGL